MIELIHGSKGHGKTKRIIDCANEASKKAKGNVVFISDKDKYSLDIDTAIRFIVSGEYGISGCDETLSFIKGVLAGNSDICNIFMDGSARILGIDPPDMENFLTGLDKISEVHNVHFTLTISTDELPAFMRRYI